MTHMYMFVDNAIENRYSTFPVTPIEASALPADDVKCWC